jgi:hypothetical protein
MRKVIVAVLAALLSGCLIGPNLSKISVGMTKEQVIASIGKPKDVAVQHNVEYLNYEGEASYADGRLGGDYFYVRLVNGRVESYGRRGDFDSTKNTTIDYTINQKITGSSEQNVKVTNSPDLYTELKKLQSMKEEGLLTEKEFTSLKKRAIENSK